MKYDFKICVVGLGYVGLPLALELAKAGLNVIGYDANKKRVETLFNGVDLNNETQGNDLKESTLRYSFSPHVIGECNFIIVAVPTPVDKSNHPDFSLLEKVSDTIGSYLKPGSIVVYESTVNPGATEEVCIPIIEQHGLTWKQHFNVGYSPERVNPGDKVHLITNTTKIVSGDNLDTLEKVAYVYSHITDVHKAPSIRVAEAAKVVENTQRDLNIAFMNELAMMCHNLNLNVYDVLAAAGTKWNFLNFTPGLVGGHCIGVDPYYLVAKAQDVGYLPELILAARRINEKVPYHIVQMIMDELNSKGNPLKYSDILIMGATFKPDVNDMRNSKVAVLAKELKKRGANITFTEPHCNSDRIEFHNEDGSVEKYDNMHVNDIINTSLEFNVVIYAVDHLYFNSDLNINSLYNMLRAGASFIFDISGRWKNYDGVITL